MKLNKHNGRFFAFSLLALIAIFTFSITNVLGSDPSTSVNNPVISQCGAQNYTFSGYFNEPQEDNDGSNRTQYRLAVYLDNVNIFTKDSQGNWSTSSQSLTVGSHTIKAQLQRRTSSNSGSSWSSWADYGSADDTDTFTVGSCPSSVVVCHRDGQSGNYSKITVSVHSVNDANGLNGHGNHSGDVWAPFTYNNVNYSGHGNYGSFNFSNCTLLGTSTPTSTATSQPTPTATATSVPTSTATSQPTESSQPSSTPSVDPSATPTGESTSTPEATASATPNGDICANLDGIQLTMPDEYHHDNDKVNCLKFELGGPPPPSNTGGSQVLGASTTGTGKVLGASTMAGTGAVEDSIFYSLFSLGSLLTSFGIMKNGKKKN